MTESPCDGAAGPAGADGPGGEPGAASAWRVHAGAACADVDRVVPAREGAAVDGAPHGEPARRLGRSRARRGRLLPRRAAAVGARRAGPARSRAEGAGTALPGGPV